MYISLVSGSMRMYSLSHLGSTIGSCSMPVRPSASSLITNTVPRCSLINSLIASVTPLVGALISCRMTLSSATIQVYTLCISKSISPKSLAIKAPAMLQAATADQNRSRLLISTALSMRCWTCITRSMASSKSVTKYWAYFTPACP